MRGYLFHSPLRIFFSVGDTLQNYIKLMSANANNQLFLINYQIFFIHFSPCLYNSIRYGPIQDYKVLQWVYRLRKLKSSSLNTLTILLRSSNVQPILWSGPCPETKTFNLKTVKISLILKKHPVRLTINKYFLKNDIYN